MFDTMIVGTNFRGKAAVEALANLPRGTRLRLQREPSNRHDPNAVAVYLDEQHLGYVPRPDNVELSRVFAGHRASSLSVELISEAVIDRGQVKTVPKIRISRGEG